MLYDIVDVKMLEGKRIWLRFDDGLEGEVDVARTAALEGVFAPLVDQGEFERIFVDKETGTVCWPCGVDLDPAVLRTQITGEPLPGQAAKEVA